MSQKKSVLSRRNFLLSAGAGGAAAAAALVVNNKHTTTESVDASDKRATRGYKVSEHIENYYRTTKV